MTNRQRRRNTYRLVDHDYADPSYAYLITLRANIQTLAPGSRVNRLRPFTTCVPLAQQAADSLNFYRHQGKWLLFAYCLMPDHLHLLASPHGGHNLSAILGQYERFVTRAAWTYGVVGSLWQRSFHDHILRKQEAATDVIAYIVSNPVRMGLVQQWEDWPFPGTPDAP